MDKKTITYFTLLMALGTFVVVMDNTIMNVSIQALVADLDTTVSGVQAAIALNALMMAAFVLFGGKLADIIGMKKTFMLGVFLYIVGSLTASFSNNLSVFILGWCLVQGLGAALMLPNVQTIIRATLSGQERAKAYGTMAGVNALGAAMGPVIGGFLTTYFSWRWAFRLEVISLVVLVLFNSFIPQDKPIAKRPSIDIWGTVLQASAMISIVLGILLISDYGLIIAKQPLMIGSVEFNPFNLNLSPALWLMALGTVIFMLFLRLENAHAEHGQPSLVQLALFKITDFVRGLKVRAIHVSVIAGVLFTVPLFMQVSFNISAFQTGLALLPLSIFLIIGAAMGVRLIKSHLPKTVVRLGAGVMILGALILVIGINKGSQPVDMALGLGVLGFGAGLVGSQIVNLILSAVSPKQTAEASGITSTLEQLGNSVGVAVLGTVLTLTLSLGLTQMINQNSVIPADQKQAAISKVEQGVNIVSDDQVRAGAAQFSPEVENEIVRIYDAARTDAFRISMLLVAFFSLVMFIFADALPKTRLDSEEA